MSNKNLPRRAVVFIGLCVKEKMRRRSKLEKEEGKRPPRHRFFLERPEGDEIVADADSFHGVVKGGKEDGRPLL
jgi:hypothetical protein